ncbi:hypothetical protein ACF1DY_26050 [Streptomyces albus]
MTTRDKEVQQVLDAIEALGKGDATERARRLTQLLDAWPTTHARVRQLRQQAIQDMREEFSYRKIAALIGISHQRVKQIEEGETTSPRSNREGTDGAAE